MEIVVTQLGGHPDIGQSLGDPPALTSQTMDLQRLGQTGLNSLARVQRAITR